MREATFIVSISVEVEFDDSMNAEMEKVEFEQNCGYSLPPTANVKVVATDWFDTMIMED